MLDNLGYRTHSKYVTLIASPQQQWSRERPSPLRNMFVACLVRLVLSFCTSEFLILLEISKARKHKFRTHYNSSIKGVYGYWYMTNVTHKFLSMYLF